MQHHPDRLALGWRRVSSRYGCHAPPPRRAASAPGTTGLQSGLATDIRLATTPNPAQPGVENLAVAINAFIVGGLQSSLGIVTGEDALFARLTEIAEA